MKSLDIKGFSRFFIFIKKYFILFNKKPYLYNNIKYTKLFY
ncbi:hypothetical protein LRLP16767_LR202_00275 [Limosilactobacillus reuteri]|uniref:Uncharacterized protein n=1 Tax=Limosilactobacillus reuteri TaxID=1598 RepID=A0A0U5F721_LIMRT|nr:hypothetical protein LRLP16767_LR202_00275 [Limosilactobacillus reuteri]